MPTAEVETLCPSRSTRGRRREQLGCDYFTPNVYTTLSELDRFCEQMELIARKGLPA